jgi:hypothetical protein
VSIPRILFLQGRGGELLDDVMDKIATAAKAKAQSKAVTPLVSSGAFESSTAEPTPTAPITKPIRVVKPAEISSKSYLETEREVEDYVAKLKAELLAVIESGYRARIQ